MNAPSKEKGKITFPAYRLRPKGPPRTPLSLHWALWAPTTRLSESHPWIHEEAPDR